MTIWHLKIFVDVADLGSMSAAAEKNQIRQPSVSQKIAELERHYGVLLFERMGNRLFITESGKTFLNMARDVVQKYDFLDDYMEVEHRRQRLRVGATVTIGSSIFANILRQYRQENPEVQLYGTITNTKKVCEKLMKNELDIALVEGKVQHSDLISIPKLQDFLVLACGKEHLFYNKQSVAMQQLNNMEFVMREEGSGTRELFEKYAQKQKLNIRTMFEYSSPEAIYQAVTLNNCLAVVSVRLMQEAARQGSIRLFRNQGTEWDRTFDLVYSRNKHISQPIRKFCELLDQYHETEEITNCEMRPLQN